MTTELERLKKVFIDKHKTGAYPEWEILKDLNAILDAARPKEVSKTYQVDFGGYCMAEIEVSGNSLKVLRCKTNF